MVFRSTLSSYQRILAGTFILFESGYIFHLAGGTSCTWPTGFQHSTWHDSQHGNLAFQGTRMVGLPVTIMQSTDITEWNCVESDSSTDSYTFLVRSDAISLLGVKWYVYVCLNLTKITTYSYLYYRRSRPEQGAGNYRVVVSRNDTHPLDTICDINDGAAGAEFVTVVKQGQEINAYVRCPDVLQGHFDVNVVSGVSGKKCKNQNSVENNMTMCVNQKEVVISYNCQSKPNQLNTDTIYCVSSIESGGHTYVQFYNSQDQDDPFSCMSISSDGTQATLVNRNCTETQTPTELPVSHNGTVIGTSYTITKRADDC